MEIQSTAYLDQDSVESTQNVDPKLLETSVAQDSNEVSSAAFYKPVRSLEELKRVLVEGLGAKKGKAVYDSFLKTWVISMVQSLQRSNKSSKSKV